MRLPNSKDLSEEQMEVYLDAPVDGDILVTGPPGTGKTVVAMLRARYLARAHKSPTVVMFNSVLRTYTGNAAEKSYTTSTLHSWANAWWHAMNIPVYCVRPLASVLIACPYRGQGDLTKLGAEWDSYKRSYRLSGEAYEAVKDGVKWPVSPAFPHGEKVLDLKWRGALSAVVSAFHAKALDDSALSWGHLVIDEAQDFGKELWEMFRVLREHCFAEATSCAPGLSVLADENQRLNEENNSTIDDIRSGLGVSGDREFTLTRNYRNTKEVSQLAKHFYVGLQTGVPKPPARRGDRPRLVRAQSFNACIGYIARYARTHDNEEIGVILRKNDLVRRYASALTNGLRDRGDLKVQAYASGDRCYGDARNLMFDRPGHITVLNRASCKGLEFDAVFIPELQGYPADGAMQDQPKMDMYVMVSRARSRVFLLYQASRQSPLPGFVRCLPESDSGLLEWCDA